MRKMTSEPLGLPRGSVRAVLTILLVGISAVMLFVKPASSEVGSMFVMLTGIAVRDYFATRTVQNRDDGPQLPAPAQNEDA